MDDGLEDLDLQPRKFPRFAVEAALVIATAGGPPRSGRTRNISKGGLCADIDGEIAAGAPCEVRLNLIFSDDAVSESLSLEARVCWCTQLGRAYQVGLVFTRLTAESTSYIDMFLRFLEGDEDASGRPTPSR